MSKPFFFRIDLITLMDFATEPDGEKMTLLQFAKELKKGKSDYPAIQEIIDEAYNYIEKKKNAGSKGGQTRSSNAQAVLESAKAKPSSAQARNRSSSSTEAVTIAEEESLKPLSGKPDRIPYKEIMDSCNSILGKNYRPTDKHKSLIKARWDEGCRKEDFEKVCRIMLGKWGKDPDKSQYLRPITLFSPKMDSYLNQVITLTDMGKMDAKAEKGLAVFENFIKEASNAQPGNVFNGNVPALPDIRERADGNAAQGLLSGIVESF